MARMVAFIVAKSGCKRIVKCFIDEWEPRRNDKDVGVVEQGKRETEIGNSVFITKLIELT